MNEEKHPIGHISFYEGYKNPNTLWIVSFEIEDLSKRQGIASRMFQIIEQSARFCDFQTIVTKVPKTNLAAQSFLHAQGFIDTGIIEVDQQDPSNTLVMKKLLL